MEGVEASPQSKACTPYRTNTRCKAALMRSAETRESWPMAIFKAEASLPRWRWAHTKKAAAMVSTTSSVSVTGSPAPSTATPRMSVPLFSLL